MSLDRSWAKREPASRWGEESSHHVVHGFGLVEVGVLLVVLAADLSFSLPFLLVKE